jgi:dihydrofolate reductase
MRKLKLQVQMSVDGFVGGPNGELDWMTWNMDEELQGYINTLTDSSSTIFLGRKMADGFIRHWTSMLSRPNDESYSFARKMIDTQKVVFTKTLDKSDAMVMGWYNTMLAKGELADEVNALKNQQGKDIIVYGGANFVSNLIGEDLIDELHLFVNPAAISNGLKIFNQRTKLQLQNSKQYECGINVLVYTPEKRK